MKTKVHFRRRNFVVSNVIHAIDNEVTYLIRCLNCIRPDGNSTSNTGLKQKNGYTTFSPPTYIERQVGHTR